MKGLVARGQRQQMTGVEAEGCAAVLPSHAAARQHYATAEFVINALDK